jgi:putative sporulation protein YtxC
MSEDPALSNGLGEFLARSVPGEWIESRAGTHVEYALTDGSTESAESEAWPMARALAQFLLTYQERPWVDELVSRRYEVLDSREKRRIVDHVLRLVHTTPDADLDRLDYATAVIFQFLAGSRTAVLEGVRLFLLGDIRREIEAAVDEAVDVHLMEQEYEEFVELLKRLVAVSSTRLEWVHVFFGGDAFYFEDPARHRVGEDLVEEISEGVDLVDGIDDLVISALVSLAPSRITVHQGYLSREGRDTLVDVFNDRVVFCGGCSRCFTPQVDTDWRSF